MAFKRLLLVTVLFCCVMLTGLLSAAPSTTAWAGDRLNLAAPTPTSTKEQFDAGSVKNTIEYSADTALIKDRIIAAVQASFSIYQPLWDAGRNTMPFSVYITLTSQKGEVDRQGRVVVGDAKIAAKQCFVNLHDYQLGLESRGYTEIVVAHEVAHCYQFTYINPAYRSLNAVPGSNWALEGSAEWLASKVYPFEFYPAAEDFTTSYGAHSPLNDLDYDALYFWESLDVQIGTPGTMAFLKSLPPTNPGSHLQSLKNVDDVFHTYATSVARAALAYLPTDLAFAQETVKVPGSLQLDLPGPFIFDVVDLNVQAPPDRGWSISISGFQANGTRVSLVNGDSASPVQEGAVTTVCDHPASLRLVSSRTNSSPTLGQLEIHVASVKCPPEKVTADCLVGAWNVIEFPPLRGFTIDYEPGDIQMTVNPDLTGSAHIRFTAVSRRGNDKVTVTASAHGQFTVQPDDQAPGRFVLTSASGVVDQMDMELYINGKGPVKPPASMLNVGKQNSNTFFSKSYGLTCQGHDFLLYEVANFGTIVWQRVA